MGRWMVHLWRSAFIKLTQDLKITVHEGCSGNHDAQALPVVCITDPKQFYRSTLGLNPAYKLSDAYCRGLWVSSDPALVVSVIAGAIRRLAGHRRNRSRRNGQTASARENIIFHYDQDPAFYQAFLDKEMHYSSARFRNLTQEEKRDSLEDAQANKAATLLELLSPSTGDRILDIGCGWGAMTKAIAPLVSHVQANTISPAQASYVSAWSVSQPQGRVRVVEGDFSALQGKWDGIISVEAIESIGRTRLPEFFQRCSDLLKPGGKLVLQSSVQSSNRMPVRRKGTWIQDNIFPGGYIPLVQELLDHALDAHLRVEKMDFLGLHYAQTLKIWRERYLAALSQGLQTLNNSPINASKWEYYFAYAQGGYMDGYLDLIQVKYVKM